MENAASQQPYKENEGQQLNEACCTVWTLNAIQSYHYITRAGNSMPAEC